MENKIDEELLSLIFKNVQTAQGSVDNIISQAHNSTLKKELMEQSTKYCGFIDECEKLAKEYNYKLTGLNLFEKTNMWWRIRMATLCNKSPRNISNLMIIGSTMGIIDLTCVLSDYSNANKTFLALAKKINDEEQNFINKLKPYLLNGFKPSNKEEDIKPISSDKKSYQSSKNTSNKSNTKQKKVTGNDNGPSM